MGSVGIYMSDQLYPFFIEFPIHWRTPLRYAHQRGIGRNDLQAEVSKAGGLAAFPPPFNEVERI